MLRVVSWDRQPRVCVVQDGHFLWFDEQTASEKKGQAKGCINFLMHKASVRRDERNPAAFIISPAEPQGWHDPSSFTGNAFRSFFFDASESEVACAHWVSTIAENIRFANLAAEQLGAELLVENLKALAVLLQHFAAQKFIKPVSPPKNVSRHSSRCISEVVQTGEGFQTELGRLGVGEITADLQS